MSPLVIDFSQLTDLAVNPSLGTINTTLLHNLLSVIVDQMQLSSNFVELDKGTMGNVVANSQQGRTSKVTEYLVIDEVDKRSGELVKTRKEMAKPAGSPPVKLFTVEVDGASRSSSSLQCAVQTSNVKPQHDQSRSDNAVGRTAANDDDVKAENSLKPTFDLINCSKRIEALEIGTRQLADIMKQFKCENDRMGSVQIEQRRENDFLQQNIENLQKELSNLCELKDWISEAEAKDDERSNKMKGLEDSLDKFSSEIQRNLAAVALLKAQMDELAMNLDEK